MNATSSMQFPAWWRYAAAGAAALALMLAVALAASALTARGAAQGVSSTVVPPAAETQSSSASQQAAAPAAAAGSAIDARSLAPAASGQSASLALPAPYPIVGGSCSASPTVQFQGRGLAATGTAAITGSEQVGTVSVTVQQSGSDAASALGAVQSRIAAVRDALAKVGVPAASVQVSYYRTYLDTLGRQFSAYASLQATVTGMDALTQATQAVSQLPGVSAYSQSSPVAAEPTLDQVQNAVGRAAAQAKDMAASAATSAGVTLGSLQSLVAQPPVTCYGSSGPQRVVQVTATYAIK
ncbi:MAG TPA: SIMPL domain-containing protein [Terriglobales bacterium]|nr:SIMPL domain-containing protein [Terriglobales bacterium]